MIQEESSTKQIWSRKLKQYYLPTVEIKDYNAIMDGRIFCDWTVKSNLITRHNIRKIATGQGDNYATGCLLDYLYLKK